MQLVCTSYLLKAVGDSWSIYPSAVSNHNGFTSVAHFDFCGITDTLYQFKQANIKVMYEINSDCAMRV